MIFSRGTRGAGKALRQACRGANRTADAAQALRIRLDALNTFAAEATKDEAVNHRADVSQALAQVAGVDPEAAVFQLANLTRHTPDSLSPDVDLVVLRAWAHAAGPNAGVVWDAAASAIRTFRERLASALAGTTPGTLSPSFRALAVERLVEWLDRETHGHLPQRPAELWLLNALAPQTAPHGPADWLCALGDLAAQRDDHEEAEARHRAAAAMGSIPARQRVAHLHATQGSAFLAGGDLGNALMMFQAAVKFEPDPEYLALLAMTRLLVDPSSDETDSHDVPSDQRDFWIGVAAIRSGDHERARMSLRQASGEPAALLLAALDGDHVKLAAHARDLRGQHGDEWAGRSLVGADPLVVAAARTDLALLADLAAAKPELSEPALAIATHAVLTAAAQSAASGDATDAVNRLRLAERMLEG